VFLTDESDKPARIGFSVTADGVHYYLTTLKLAPHETRAIGRACDEKALSAKTFTRVARH